MNTRGDMEQRDAKTNNRAGEHKTVKPVVQPTAVLGFEQFTLHQRLNRTLGNQSVLRLLRSGALQAKLTVSRPDEKYEQEADRVADQVMRMPEPVVQAKPCCSLCGEEEQVQRKSVMITPVGSRRNSDEGDAPHTAATEDAAAVEGRIDALQGNGKALPDETRKYFEPRFGSDFGAVRVHHDTGANALARSVSARAFTTDLRERRSAVLRKRLNARREDE